ncbi:MAG TPA: FHA domain-containing protein [Kofleriaceae bacterium]|jgi:hypothetical protein
MAISTNTDAAGGNEWAIFDDIDGFTFWGTAGTRTLPADSDGPFSIGASETSWLQLHDPMGRVSRDHAELRRFHKRWTIVDLGSKNGIHQDGARRMSFPLSPGVEVGIGSITMVATSPKLRALRELLARLIGWSDARREDVDLALRAVRTAATRRGSLLLCGDGDLVAIARLLHGHALGHDRPFVVCDPRRTTSEETARAPTNYDTGIAALEAATGGTLCIWQMRQPDDFDRVLETIRKPSSRAQLVVCARALKREPLIASPITIPPVEERPDERDRIIDGYGADAVAALGGSFAAQDRQWIARNEGGTHADIERAAHRLVALRATNGKITSAAAMLGMSHGALSEWIARRDMPMPIEKD